MVWVGLSQAYLLMTIIAVLLIIHAWGKNQRRWHAVGALAHVDPLAAALTSMPLFAGLRATGLAYGAIAFHTLFVV
jgi:Zn-dependent M16 (insulinase) family peptidase